MPKKTVVNDSGLDEIKKAFNRALYLTFSKTKLLFAFSVLALCGLLSVFFRGVAVHSGSWVTMSLTFLPVFICAGIMLSMGLILIRVYHNEVKGLPVSFKETLNKSLELMIGASYISMPFILVYLLLWMVLGIFYLLKEIPGLGDFIGVILAFGPFLLNLASLLLILSALAVLFFVTPALALRSFDKVAIVQLILKRIRMDVFTNCCHLVIALLPLTLTGSVLSIAAVLTGTTYLDVDRTSEIVLQWFFIMLPFTALLAPATIFFFNFAAESHVALQKQRRAMEG